MKGIKIKQVILIFLFFFSFFDFFQIKNSFFFGCKNLKIMKNSIFLSFNNILVAPPKDLKQEGNALRRASLKLDGFFISYIYLWHIQSI